MQILSSPNTYASNNQTPTAAPPNEQARSAQQELLTSLGKYLNTEQIAEVVDADQADFSAEKVSSRIADFVAQGLAAAASRGASQERLDSLYQSAVEGVKKGFAEALEILEEMEQFTGPVKDLYQQTEALTFDKLAQIDPAAAASQSVDQALAASMEYRESFKLKLVTQDGDKVEIRFNNREAASVRADRDGFAVASESRSGYQLKVEGNLDEQEYAAIENVLSQVSDVADDFYAGRVNEAFNLASKLNVDPNELARLDLNMKQSVRLEVQEYQQVEKQAHPEHPWAQRLQNWLASVDQLRTEVDEVFAQGEAALNELLLAAVDVRGADKGLPPGLEKVLADRIS